MKQIKMRQGVVMAVLLLSFVSQLPGAEIKWKGVGSGWFQTASYWEGGVVPGADDMPHWTNLNNNAVINFNADAVTANARFSRDSGQTSVQMHMGAGRTYTVTNVLDTAFDGAGAQVVRPHSGTLAVTNASGTATMNLRALSGQAPHLIWGGTLIVDHLLSDTNSPWGLPYQFYLANGTVILKGDSELISSGYAYLGQYGHALFNIIGGTSSVPTLQVGYQSPADFVVEGPDTHVTMLRGGPKFEGSRCIVSNGAYLVASGISMSGPSNLWLVSGPGSRLDVLGQVYSSTGSKAYSHFRIEKGGVMTAGTQTYLGSSTGSGPVTMTIDGVGSRFESGASFEVGDQVRSIGSVKISNGGELFMVKGWIGISVGMASATAGTGTVTVTSGGILDTQIMVSGTDGSGTITNTGGGIFQFRSRTPTITTNTPGSIVVDGGTVAFRNLTDVSVKGNWSGTQVANILFLGDNAFRLNTATNTTTGQDYVFDTGLGATNYCRLEMVNGGTMYRGGTVTIGSGGSLLMSNTVATLTEALTSHGVVTFCNATGTFNQAFSNYGQLEGFGTLDGTVTNFAGSRVAPGRAGSTGVLTVGGSLVMKPDATLICKLDGASQYDSLILAAGGTLDLGGCDLEVELGFMPTVGQQFTIIDNQGGDLQGAFSASGVSAVYNERAFSLHVQYAGGDGNDVMLTVMPQSTMLLIR